MQFIIHLLVGAIAGLLSGFGIGGGTLLVLWLTLFTGAEQHFAAGINLSYFPFTAVPAIYGHAKNHLIDKKAVLVCALCGVPACIIGAFTAASLDLGLLRRFFGIFVLIIGIRELFSGTEKHSDPLDKSSRR